MNAYEDAVQPLINGGYPDRQAREILSFVCGEAQNEGYRRGEAAAHAEVDRLKRSAVLAEEDYRRVVRGACQVESQLRARVAELEAQQAAVLALHRKHADSNHCFADDETWPCNTRAALAPVVDPWKCEANDCRMHDYLLGMWMTLVSESDALRMAGGAS
ncbi:hypothetical protein ACFVT1_36645 [Streptomyces sp. NPDC057963]|uniref:hypothetical protein n=1 Tax=Streptomyces sp. NPDC057963 TaxID=3346290 RepID=UPI0036EAAACC